MTPPSITQEAAGSPESAFEGTRAINVAHPDDVALTAEVASGANVITATDGQAGAGAEARLDEDARSLDFMEVAEANRHYLHLKDGQLHRPRNVRSLTRNFVRLALEYDYQHFITIGLVDKHSDHRAVNGATVLAAWRLRRMGKHVQTWTLDFTGEGEKSFLVDKDHKYKALLFHESQFRGPEDIDTLTANEPHYASLMKREVYRRSDSWFDIARAGLRSFLGYRRRIPHRDYGIIEGKL